MSNEPTIIRIDNIPQSEINKGPLHAVYYIATRRDAYTGRRLILYNRTTRSTYQVICFMYPITPLGWVDHFYLTIWTKKNTPKVSRAKDIYCSNKQMVKIVEKKILEGYEMMDLGLNLSLKIDTVYFPWRTSHKEDKVNLLLTTSKDSDKVILSSYIDTAQAIMEMSEEGFVKRLSDSDFFLIAPLLGRED